MSPRTGQHWQNRRCDWRDDVMLVLVPAVRSYFWIFNRCPIIPMGLTKQKTHWNAADGSSCPCYKQMWLWRASCTSCLAMSSELGCSCCQPELMHCLLFPSPRNTRSLKSLISTLPACPLLLSPSGTNNATETEAELIISWSCCQNSALTRILPCFLEVEQGLSTTENTSKPKVCILSKSSVLSWVCCFAAGWWLAGPSGSHVGDWPVGAELASCHQLRFGCHGELELY